MDVVCNALTTHLEEEWRNDSDIVVTEESERRAEEVASDGRSV